MTDAAVADHTDPNRSTRRALLGAGVLGAALAVAVGREVAAGTVGLSEEDKDLLGFAIAYELSARDLYDEAIAAGADDDIWQTMREQHESYAQLLAGISGISADIRSDEFFDEYASEFDTRDPAGAALELENVTAATSFELIGMVTDVDAAGGLASIGAMESRQAAVFAVLSGQGDDPDTVFVNTASPISPEVTS